jgi:hypothetical protein
VFEDNTPVYPFEYDHLLLYSEADYHVNTEEDRDGLEEDLFNHETYKYH